MPPACTPPPWQRYVACGWLAVGLRHHHSLTVSARGLQVPDTIKIMLTDAKLRDYRFYARRE